MPSRGIRFSIVLLLLGILRVASAAAVTLPQDFVYDSVAGAESWNLPTALAFLPDGRLLVAEKAGRLWVVIDNVRYPVPVWDGHTEVLSNGDRGLLAIAVDPGFAANHYLYLLYTVDPDSDDVDDDNDAFGRLTRYTMSVADTNVVDPASRTILMGADWRHGAPSGSGSHTIGGLRWGSDGSLLVTAGDGGHYERGDSGGLDPDLFGPTKTNPYEDIGAFRAQYLGSLDGKILRLDPATGNGYASNPFYDGDLTSTRSKVYAYGCRNTFRFSVAPGTGSSDPADGNPGVILAGDVGWNTFEEFNVVDQPGLNFGWPCTEGFEVQAVYDTLTPPFHCGCDSIGAIPWNPSPITLPRSAWHHVYSNLSVPPGFIGNSVTCGVVYTGTRYPTLYRNHLFIGDFGRGWIKMFVMDASWNVAGIVDFADVAEGPVDLIADPVSGDLYYIAIFRNDVRRIRYTGDPSNHAPVAVAVANPSAGPVPFQAGLSGAASHDDDLDPLTALWTFGDGMGASGFDVTHTYTSPGRFEAVLTVSDPFGGIGRDTAVVIVTADASFPASTVLDDFRRPDGPVGPPWSGQPGAFALSESTLVSVSDGWMVYGTPMEGGPTFGPTQEAFVTVTTSAATATAIDLLLKVQGGNPQNGHLRVHYDGTQQEFWFEGSAPGSWFVLGDPVSMALAPGDVFGARAYESGALELYVNGVLVKGIEAPGWPLHHSGGSIGIELEGAQGVRCDDFGGGTTVLDPNTPPTAVILLPQPGLFFAAGDTIRLSAAGSDAEDPPDSLAYLWDVDLHHNNHIHPSIFTSTEPATFFLGENHDDGTGVFYEVRLRVTDTGGKFDTTSVAVHPDVDLTLDPPWSVPVAPGSLQPALYGVTLRNAGPMPSPLVRWDIAIDGLAVASGDTLIAAGDSAAIQVLVPPQVGAGWHTLSAAVGVLDQVVEPDESNNMQSVPLLVVEGGGTSGVPDAGPLFRVGVPRPNPARGSVSVRVETPGPAEVSAAVFDVAGRRVATLPSRSSSGGTIELTWDGRAADGGTAAAGVYQILVRAGRNSAVRRVVRLAP